MKKIDKYTKFSLANVFNKENLYAKYLLFKLDVNVIIYIFVFSIYKNQ